MKTSQLTMTIGAVSRATGIPVNTLRTWERRYKFPTAERSDGGQRLYSPEVIQHLNLINNALQKGFRPKQVMGLERSELEALVGKNAPPKPTEENEVQLWVDAARRLDGDFLDASFHLSSSQLGLQGFVTEKLVPFVQALGSSWVEGKIQIFHEHFASERIHDFLTSRWRPLSDKASGPNVLFASLPGEKHFLGLHMAATIVALYGFRIIFLGPHTPLLDLQACAWQSDSKAIMLSISATSDHENVSQKLIQLRKNLSPNIHIVVGGRGAPTHLEGVTVMTSLTDLASWAIQMFNHFKLNRKL